MDKKSFDIIYYGIRRRANVCKVHFKDASTAEELHNISAKRANSLGQWARAELGKMDKITQIDLRHIIGMGDLTASQTSMLIKALREYMGFRPALQTFARYLTDHSVPNMPKSSRYVVESFGKRVYLRSENGRFM